MFMENNKIITFVKKEIVLIIASFLAIISCFFVKPNINYISYIDFRTLTILFSLMSVVEGLSKNNVFKLFGQKLVLISKTTKELVLSLVLICFFTSMLITNDVALITFVPFAIIVLKFANLEYLIIYVVVLQTIASNLGSMVTPMGNPQNLYLFSLSNMDIINFMLIILPYAIVSLILIFFLVLFIKNKSISNSELHFNNITINKKQVIIFLILFIICILTVLRLISFLILFVIILIVIFIIDKSIFKKVDYSLLLTFVAFFIFVGNIGNISFFKEKLNNVLIGRECFISILLSQLISNVPAALLLSNFTNNYKELIIGTNLGGLGTLIASMASLISYKKFVINYPKLTAKYLLSFTLYNILFLLVLICMKIFVFR